ncbi:hypothetical protein HUG15_19575 [Salicibibacter cibarius]|uniref:LPXTG cell wall anchor domain-containing protein n=1 Tax=Salicibibacter cibarius TaxID=2743000 RepID=A0A7T6Z5W8_9BACI|nr:hypothetical protein [Salicibibacter cibarius]QQK77563.1 hypothetical protein HUG15_19575 [Salicibibacter cibarius]
MVRQASILMLAVVLLFYPGNAMAVGNGGQSEDVEDVVGEEDAGSDEEVEESSNEASDEADQASNEEEDGTEESEDGNNEDEDGAEESEEGTNEDEDGDSEEGNEEDEVEEDGSEEATNDEETEDGSEESGEGNNEDDAEEGTEEDEEDGGSEDATEEEDGAEDSEEANDDDVNTLNDELDLDNLNGVASGFIEFDEEVGHFVLDLQAGVHNHSDIDVNDKWIAFELPAGVNVPDGLMPDGVYSVTLENGNQGLAAKLPDIIGAGDSEFSHYDIPLEGDPADPDPPHYTLYLFDINVENDDAQSLGNINYQRSIEFSDMDEDNGDPGDPEEPGDPEDPEDPELPELDIEGSVDGSVSEFDSDERQYTLDVTVDTANNTEEEIESLYTGFELPEGVSVGLDVPEGVELLDVDGSDVLGFQLPEGDGEVTYEVPVFGQTSESVNEDNLNAYVVDGQYEDLGPTDVSANVDFSDMDDEWYFDAASQIVPDFPGLNDDEFAMNFGFDVQNITWDDVNGVNIEFDVPSEITVYEPDEYEEGEIPDELEDFFDEEGFGMGESLDIEWDGNTASITLDTLDGGEGYQGFFNAIGESSVALEELENLTATVTLFRDGDEEVMEIDVPFELVDYDGGEPAPDPEPDPEPEPEPEPDPDNGGNGDGDGNGDGENGTGNGENGTDNGNGTGDDNGTKDTVPSKDRDASDDTPAGIDDRGTGDEIGGELPDTAGNSMLMVLIGTLIAAAGVTALALRKKFIMTS